MWKYFCLMLVLVGFAQNAMAFNKSSFVWTEEKFKIADSGDFEKGKALSKKMKCYKCHGDIGISDDSDIPSLAGQRETYLFKQLSEFSMGARNTYKKMTRVAKKLSIEDMTDLARFYGKQKPAKMRGGEKIQIVEVCDSCHDKERIKEDAVEVAPVIKGQSAGYLMDTMMAFREQARNNDLYSRMQAQVNKLSDEEVEKLIHYYSAVIEE